MKKQNKINRINIRCTDEEWYFLQNLKLEGINITSFITSTFKNTNQYKKYYNLINGIY